MTSHALAPRGRPAGPAPGFDVVALAASAGGLQALSAVLAGLPAGFPAAVIVMLHMSGGRSALVEILARRTSLGVAWAADGVRLRPGQVLVCPSRSTLVVLPDATCGITAARGTRDRPGDALLASLAESHGPRALAVVLTGMGSDGAEGARALNAAGGTIVAESEETAAHPSMPRAAVETGAVDLVLPLHRIGPALADMVAGRRPPPPRVELRAAEALFAGPGEMRELLRAIDWSATELGAVAGWPQDLCATLRTVLAARTPMCILWGPRHVQLYNDAYVDVLGAGKHPQAAGRPADATWAERWDEIGPRLERALGGEALQACDERLEPERDGLREEAYFTVSYSPLADDAGADGGGVLELVSETTARVLGERRLATLAAMETRAASAPDVCEAAARALAGNALDVPFALFYLLDEPHGRAQLCAATGLEPGTFAAPHVLRLGSASWPLAKALRAGGPLLVDDLEDRLMGLAAGPWPDAPRAALLLPLAVAGEPPAGVLVAGLSPRRPLDEPYRAFLELVAGQVAAGVAAARASQRDRERLEALAALDSAKTEFFANVSYEFRTPLTRVLASLEGALRDPGALPAAVAGELELAGRNGRRLLALVDQLLDFSRAQAGRLDADYERADLARDTAAVASLFAPAAEHAGLRLAIDCPPLAEPVWVDPEMWQVIVANLISNALKFTFAGDLAVTLRALPRHAELTVRDTGVGIPPGELPHVFERFHRVEGRRARTQEGAGLGLALVHELVGVHHGRVHVRSTLGAGTTVSVWVPLGARIGAADTEAGAPREPCAVAVALAEAAAGWGGDDAAGA